MPGFIDVDGDIEAHFHEIPAGGNEVAPPGFQIVQRVGIIRLGPDMHIHTATHHGSLGIVEIASLKDASTGNEWMLKVTTDFDEERELVMGAVASPDQSLVKKGLLPAGASGGGATTLFRIQSTKTLTYGESSSYAAGVALPPHSKAFNSGVDNLWVAFISLRALV